MEREKKKVVPIGNNFKGQHKPKPEQQINPELQEHLDLLEALNSIVELSIWHLSDVIRLISKYKKQTEMYLTGTIWEP